MKLNLTALFLRTPKWLIVPAIVLPIFSGVLLLLLIGGWLPMQPPEGSLMRDPHSSPSNLATLPLSFELNAGQAAAPAQYIVHQASGWLLFGPSEVTLALPGSSSMSPQPPAQGDRADARATDDRSDVAFGSSTGERTGSAITRLPSTLKLSFINTLRTTSIAPSDLLPGKVNYLTGSDPRSWKTSLPTYRQLIYSGLYPGVDLAYSGQSGLLKSTYAIQAYADPAAIRWRYEGAQHLSLDAEGNMVIELSGAALSTGTQAPVVKEQAPIAWQDVDGTRVAVDVHYEIGADGSVGFRLGPYDTAKPLTIDPTLTYSTYLGGYYEDGAHDVALDAAGNIYLAGYAFSPDYPTTAGSFQPALGSPYGEDAYVTKLSPDGSTMLYSTFLGGLFDDRAQALAVDPGGSAYITGWTSSADFPLAHPEQPNCGCSPNDVFVSKLSADGSSLDYSTYLGGQVGENGYAIAVDHAGNALVGGMTGSPDFPLQNPYQSFRGGFDGFLTLLSADGGTLLYSTYLGGSVGNTDWVNGVALDEAGHLYATGLTDSNNFPTTPNAYQQTLQANFDAFVSELNPSVEPNQQLLYSTYFGGELNDFGAGIALDAAGKVYVLGDTDSMTAFPVSPGAFQTFNHGGFDAFVAKFDTTQSGLTSLVYSTFLGGSMGEDEENPDRSPPFACNIAVDASGDAYVVGRTGSADFPTANPIQATKHGVADAFVSELNPAGSGLIFSTYLGGDGSELATGLALDTAANIYVAGFTGSQDFPVVNAIQLANGGSGQDAFVSKILVSTQTPGTPKPGVTASPSGTPPSATPTACVPQSNYVIHTAEGATIVPGTGDIGVHCDDCIAAVSLPFTVTVYGSSFTTANISSNGNIQFLSSDPGPGEDVCFPQVSFNYVVAPYLADLSTLQGGVYTSTSGVAPDRIFNVEWRGCVYTPGHACSDQPVNFEVRFYESSPDLQIDFIYAQVDDFGDRGVAGIQKGTGELYKLYECLTPNGLYPGLKVTFTLPSCSSQPTATGTPPTVTPTRTRPPTHTATPTPDSCHFTSPWQPKPTMIVERGHLAGVVADDRLYTIGGTNARPGSYVDDVERFDPASGSWTTLASLPVPARRAGAAVVDHKIYVAGGTEGSTLLSTMQIYDIDANTWSQGAPLPAARAGAAVASINGKVYIVGGEQANFFGTTTVWEYDPATNTYVTKAPLPVAEYDMGATLLGNRIYVVGGFDTFAHYAYDPATDSWSSIAPGRTPNFAEPATFTLNGELWLVGGTFSYVRPYGPGQQTQIYSPLTNGWRYGPMLDLPRYQGPAGGVINGRGYVVGGVDASTVGGDYTYLNSMESIGYLPCSTTTPPVPTATASTTATPAACAIVFSDVDENSPFYPFIRCLACRGFVDGYPDGTFRPNNSVTRGQLSKIVSNTSGFNDPQTDQLFEDVPPGSTFFDYIGRLASRGVMQGYPCGGFGEPCGSGNLPYFRPNNNATRGQITKIVANAAGLNDPPIGQQFEDVPEGSTFYTYTYRLVTRDVMQGYPCGGFGEPCGSGNLPYFRPFNNATRGQTSKVVANTFYPNCQTRARR